MPRQDKPRTILGFDPYGYNRYLQPLPEGNPHLARHYLGTAEVWVQIDSDSESFYLDRHGDYWELSRDGSLLARALAERLPDDPLVVGEMLLTELWCIRWPVAIGLLGCDHAGELGPERWSSIKAAYDQHTEKNWPPERVEQALETKERMRRAVVDSEPGKVWAVEIRNGGDARWCLSQGVPCSVRRHDDGKKIVLEFDSFDDFGKFRGGAPRRSGYPAWIQHADGRIEELEGAA